MRPIRNILGKWQFIYELGRDPYRYRGWRFSVGLLRLTSFPMPGFKFGREHHDGIAITIYLSLPITNIRCRHFQTLGLQQMITYPTWVNLKSISCMVEIW